jgi:hypothetical protein
MRIQIFKCVLFFIVATGSMYSIQAQLPNANSFSGQVNYTGYYKYGVNMNFTPGWNAEHNATISIGNPSINVKGVGLRTYRVPLYDDFLSAWGVGIELPKFRFYANLGADDHTAFVGQPSPEHRETVTYPGSPEQSKSFKNLFEPIWLDAGQTQINPNNYYAKYMYDVVTTYGQYIKFWEVMNEPDFTYTASGWADTWMTRNPTPDELPALRAPIFHYIRMLRISWEVVKRLQPTDLVCVGGLGYRGFLDAILRNTDNPTDGSVNGSYPLKGGAYFDVISFHNYPMYDVRIGNRNSDKAAAAFIHAKNLMENVAVNHGYNGSQYPRKQFISTETGISRTMQGDTWGSVEGQRNFAIKTSVLSQKNNIRQVYWYKLSDGSNANDQHDQMGMYYDLSYTSQYNQVPTDQGKAFKTTSDLLYGKTYDAGMTAVLALPSTVEGAAFRGADGTFTYVLWAKTVLDVNETAAAVYSFPSSIMSGTNVVRKEWDFAYTNASVTIPKTGIALTGSPSFFTDASGSAPSGNQSPVVNAGPDQTVVLPLNSATLTGNSNDVDGTVVSSTWAQVSGPSPAGIISQMQATTPIMNLVQGVYQFEFKVTDNLGAVSRDTVQVSVNLPPVSGRIEAENYTNMFGIQKENTLDAGGGQNLGYMHNGDWMDYQVYMATAGTYKVDFRIASPAGGKLEIRNSAGTVLTTITIPSTGGYQTWQTTTGNVALPAGINTIRIHSLSSDWNFNWWEIGAATSTTPPPPPSSGTTIRVEAENYTSMNGVQKENTSDAGGGQNVGYIDTGDWMDFNINPASTGSHTVSFRVATQNTGGQILVKKMDGTTIGTVAVPVTGGWQTWQTVTTTINLTAGSQAIRIYSGNGNWNINWFELASGTTTPPPTSTPTTIKVEAENYTNHYGTQKETTSDAGGGQNLGYIDYGDWMDYAINPATAGTYNISVRVASTSTGGQVQLKKLDGTVLGTVTLPNTGGWQTWQTATGTVTLAAGQQTLRLYASTYINFNINWFELTSGTSGGGSTVTTIKLEAEAFTAQNGIQTENTSDAGGGQNIGYVDINDWMDYSVNTPAAGNYAVNLRVAATSVGKLEIRNSAGTVLATVAVPNTGGYQAWQTVTANIALPAGQQTLRIHAASNGWNLNWWEIIGNSGSITTRVAGEAEIIESTALSITPNLITERFQLGITNDLTGAVSVQVLDLQGAVQKQFSLTKTNIGAVQFYLSLSGVSAGNYEVKVTMGDWSETQKIIKQ